MAREANGGGTRVGIDDDFQAVFKNSELDEMAESMVRLEGVEAGFDHRGLKLPSVVFGHSGKFCETADGASSSSGEARVGVKMQRNAFRVSGHWCPRE